MNAFKILSFLSLLLLIEAQVLKKKKSGGLTDCILLDLCDCKEKGVGKLKECYQMLDKEVHSWAVECVNECGLEANLTALDLEANGEILCNQPRDALIKCLNECSEKSRPYLASVYSDPDKTAVMQSLNQAQGCVQVLIGECQSFPDTCV